jgi:hypothetical protein
MNPPARVQAAEPTHRAALVVAPTSAVFDPREVVLERPERLRKDGGVATPD